VGDDSPCGHQEGAELDAVRTVARWAGLAASADIRTILAAMYWLKNFTGEPAGFEV
jgi:cob(I)alamin adenosyltransferase